MRLDEIASKGLVGMVLTAGSGYMGTVAPYGGREKEFGTNLEFLVPSKQVVIGFVTGWVVVFALLALVIGIMQA